MEKRYLDLLYKDECGLGFVKVQLPLDSAGRLVGVNFHFSCRTGETASLSLRSIQRNTVAGPEIL